MKPSQRVPEQLTLFDLPAPVKPAAAPAPDPAPPAVVSGLRTEVAKVAAAPSSSRTAAPVDVPMMIRLRLVGSGAGWVEPQVLFEQLDARMERRLHHLALTANRTRILSCLPAEDGPTGSVRLRLHWCFAKAPDALLDEVARFALGTLRGAARRRALAAIREHFREHTESPRGRSALPRPRRTVLRPRGHCYDLRQLRDEVNQRYFGGQLKVHITWGKVPARRASDRRVRKRSIHLGTYTEELNLVRIHRKLDQPWVPRFVVESVVHHEMLHAALPATLKDGRRRVHTPEFRRRERQFERFREAEAWIRDNLQRLLSGTLSAP